MSARRGAAQGSSIFGPIWGSITVLHNYIYSAEGHPLQVLRSGGSEAHITCTLTKLPKDAGTVPENLLSRRSLHAGKNAVFGE